MNTVTKSAISFKPDFNRLLKHLKFVARERNYQTTPQTLAEVQSYLRNEFLSYGLNVRDEAFVYEGQTFSNLVAVPLSKFPKPRLIIGAHFDSVFNSPGADDNASGVAALLEIARLFVKTTGTIPSEAIGAVEFVAFNLEEYGMIGSRAYARKLKKEGAQIAGMLSLEMIGFTSQKKGSQKMPFFLKPFYPEAGNFIGLVANTKSIPFLNEVKKNFKRVTELPVESLSLPANGWVFPDVRLSDHSPFWDEGFSALMVTDTSFFRNPYYHTEEDRIETLDLNFLAQVTEAVAGTAHHFAARQV